MSDPEPRRPVTPNDFLRTRDPLIASYVQMWRMGQMSWEQTMMELAMELSRQNKRLVDELTKGLLHRVTQ